MKNNLKAIEERVQNLEQTIEMLEDHLREYGHLIKLETYEFIVEKIRNFKRELKIRKDFPLYHLQ